MDPRGRVDLGGRGGGDLTMESAPIDLVQSALVTALVVATPILLVALVVGLITALLQAGAEVKAKDNQGKTALAYGRGNMNREVVDGLAAQIVDALVQAGAE